jgi:hypothetical protein
MPSLVSALAGNQNAATATNTAKVALLAVNFTDLSSFYGYKASHWPLSRVKTRFPETIIFITRRV